MLDILRRIPLQRAAAFLAVLLLALMGFLAGGAALRESPTVDEMVHIAAGVSYLQKLDLRMNEEHPPLAKMLAALPLVLHHTYADYSGVIWSASQKFLSALFGEWIFGAWLVTRWNHASLTLVLSRLPMLLMMLALGWMTFVYARRLGGAWGGLLCLTLYVSAPVFLTFGPLVLTDTAVTLFSLLAVWALAEMWRNPSRRHITVFGVTLAAALLSKFSAGILLIAFLTFAVSTRWRPVSVQPTASPDARAWRRLRWRGMGKGTLLAALIVYAFYLVFSWNQPIDITGLTGHGPVASLLGRLLMPPWLFFRGFAFFVIMSPRPVFLLGHPYTHGVWFYFPVLFMLKSAPGLLGLLMLALVLTVARKRSGGAFSSLIPEPLLIHWRALWISLLVFGGICLLSPVNISLRHFSIPTILLILLLAPLPRMLERTGPSTWNAVPVATALVFGLAVSCLYTSVRAFPYYVPYVNFLSLGHPVYTMVNDSNVDWNQALPEVQRFVQQHRLGDVPLDAFGFSDAKMWVPQSRFWNCQMPATKDAGKWAVVSANMILDFHNCGWLMRYRHLPLGGGSMYAVQLPAQIPPAGSLGGPPVPADFREFPGVRGGTDLRLIFLEGEWHPEKIPELNTSLVAEYQKSHASSRKK